jgi:hypothetical protein
MRRLLLAVSVFLASCALTYSHDGSKVGVDFSGSCSLAKNCHECTHSTTCVWCAGRCVEHDDLTCEVRTTYPEQCR